MILTSIITLIFGVLVFFSLYICDSGINYFIRLLIRLAGVGIGFACGYYIGYFSQPFQSDFLPNWYPFAYFGGLIFLVVIESFFSLGQAQYKDNDGNLRTTTVAFGIITFILAVVLAVPFVNF